MLAISSSLHGFLLVFRGGTYLYVEGGYSYRFAFAIARVHAV